jgi:serine/threonine protein phosphatase PrpC
VDRQASSGARQLTVKPEEAFDIVEYGTSTLPPMQLRFSYSTQRGCYPEASQRKNQDNVLIRPSFAGRPELHLFGVFDGHGTEGHTISAYVRDQIESALHSELTTLGLDRLGSLPNEVITDAMQRVYMSIDKVRG